MINSISLINFKSYKEARLPLASLSLLIGANASGKSNAIEGIRFLSWLAEGRRLDDLMSAVQAQDQSLRGTIRDLVYQTKNTQETDEAIFGFNAEDTDETGTFLSITWWKFQIRIQVTTEGMRVVSETMSAPDSEVPLYTAVEPARQFSHEISVRYNNFARGGIKPQIPCSDQQAIFTQLETPARFSTRKAQREIPYLVGALRRFFEEILFLDPSPRAMRKYSFIVEKKLKGDGSNLSSVLYDLCIVKAQKDRVLRFIQSLPEQDIRDVGFLETPRNEVMLTLTENFAGEDRKWDAAILSDGTLRVLAVAAALLSAPEGSLVIIEEIDNGVHPSRAGILLENIQDVAKARKIRVLVTTHNPALLDALPLSAVPDVVCCYRDPIEGDSRLIRLAEVRNYPELVAQGPLGQLMTTGILDRYLKDKRTDDEKKAQALDWLDNLGKTGTS